MLQTQSFYVTNSVPLCYKLSPFVLQTQSIMLQTSIVIEFEF